MIDPSHPRATSLRIRNILVRGVKQGVTSLHGLTAHGRGEAFDYLLGERTHPFARQAVQAAAAMLLLAKHPVLSVNGNVAALAAGEMVRLSRLIPAHLEVNLFHASREREDKIVKVLKKYGAETVLRPDETSIANIASNRRMVSAYGQKKADVIFIPLEDGDRTKALVNLEKRVITVDLNPVSRTAEAATVTIIDNIVRVMPHLIRAVREGKKENRQALEERIQEYDNENSRSEARIAMQCS